jgi:sugar transferase (PEP-CTERM/EpsH1 system associated)
VSAPLHVVHVVHSLGVGGLENGVVNLVTGPADAFRHSIVCLTEVGALGARLGERVTAIALGKRPGHDPAAFARLVARLRRLRPDVVHTRNWASFDAVLAARLARVPVVIHGEHGRDITDPDGRHPLRNRLRRLAAPLISRFVAVSDDLRRWLVEQVGVPAGKVVHICNGVDTTRFSPGDRAIRAGLGLGAESVLIGTVARLDPVKDQAGLLEAFALVARQRPEAILMIAGDGPCRGALHQRADSLGLTPRVRFLGERSDVPDLLRAMDVFVLPSIAEGISNTVLEAMATGLPIVATRVGGNPELVEDGVNGLLVPRSDVPALARALDRYLDDPALGVLHGKSSRERAVDVFDLQRMRQAYGDLYIGLARGRRRSG